MGTRIQWNADENRIVACRWVDICKQRDIDPLNPVGISELADEAQQAISDPARRRPAGSMKSMQSIERLLQYVAVVLEERKKSAKAQEAADREAREREEREAAQRRQQQEKETLAPRAPAPPAFEPAMQTGTMEDKVRAFAAQASGILVEEMIKALRGAFVAEFPMLLARATAVSKVLPRILVCGPLTKQQPMLEEAVMGIADLKFVSSEESPSLIKLRGQNCVAGVTWVNYVNHGHTDAVRALFGDERAVLVKGGMDTLKSKIEEVALHAQIPETISTPMQ